MSNWLFLALLHNLSLQEPVENGYIAIVPDTDDRAISLIKTSLALRRMVSGFTDQFGRRAFPSLMIVNPKAPKRLLSQDALIGFRNAIAICSIIKAWEEALVRRQSLNVLKYSNYFNLYPIVPGKNGDLMITRSPSILGADDPEEFAGQISPELASTSRVTDFYDKELLKAILLVWEERFLKHRLRDWQSLVLFRSLEMAFQASTIPFENSSTIYDYGAKIALWVSAFEVLSRSETERASLTKVLQLLGTPRLYAKNLTKKLYSIQFSKGKRGRCTLTQKLYYMLYSARNNFLHGNPVKICNVFIKDDLKYHALTSAAPIIYKLALQSFLNIPRLGNRYGYDTEGFINIGNFEGAINALIQKRPQRKIPHPKISPTRAQVIATNS